MRFVRVFFSLAISAEHAYLQPHSIVPSAPFHFCHSRFQDSVIPQCNKSSVAMHVSWSSIASHIRKRPCSPILTKRVLPYSSIHIGYHPQDTEALFLFRYHQFSGDEFGIARTHARTSSSQTSCSRILTKRILPSSCITIGYHPQDTAASFSFSDTIGFPVRYSGSHARTHGPFVFLHTYALYSSGRCAS